MWCEGGCPTSRSCRDTLSILFPYVARALPLRCLQAPSAYYSRANRASPSAAMPRQSAAQSALSPCHTPRLARRGLVTWGGQVRKRGSVHRSLWARGPSIISKSIEHKILWSFEKCPAASPALSFSNPHPFTLLPTDFCSLFNSTTLAT